MRQQRLMMLNVIFSALVIAVVTAGTFFFGLTGHAGNLLVASAGLAALAGIAFLYLRSERTLREVQVLLNHLSTGEFRNVSDRTQNRSGCSLELFSGIENVAHALKHEKGMNKGIIEGLPTPFLLVDVKERALFTNQACLDMLQIEGPPEKQYGRTLAEIFYNDPTRQTAVGKAINHGQVFRNLEVTITGHKGGVRHVLANVCPLYDLDGVCIGGFCLYVDMTALKTKETQIHEQNQIISQAADKATNISNSMASAAEELAAQVEEASRGAEEQRARTAETATAMEEMNATVLEVAKNASQAAEASDQARTKALAGAKVVGESVSAINKVQQQSVELKSTLSQLGEQANQIDRIMNVIEDIADQTNLLALNAAIEAARAGDAGRGFAVVADEVRKLAEKTMNATKEVGQAIADIQKGTRSNIEGMDKAMAAIEEATARANTSGAALQEILALAELAADQVRSIATAAEQQSATSEEINRGVEDINRISSETSEIMNQSAEAVSELARMAVELNSIIERMRDQSAEKTS
ncbi:methyl-accepting chemotaxis sensory transducer with Pas/Pac sensor [Desulfonatronum thiosulfatophilum]|uniref:Methyl-accepting chemotaxis sensory transducer with Pas/Pac sensor n=1 Tax=Desulfonatronum thiosulfatophilum TaxID=617002 RepID=A0A1G6A4H9_9BACT|nr:methyl-accepting chemotaxis protein [Desulfonatronum thiosulfatophilum]SDB03295.1 methyl-accepting chemotaxis sensory transducer with Pas/Pac sensor [Desulfonatronum thiosulfatophilum]